MSAFAKENGIQRKRDGKLERDSNRPNARARPKPAPLHPAVEPPGQDRGQSNQHHQRTGNHLPIQRSERRDLVDSHLPVTAGFMRRDHQLVVGAVSQLQRPTVYRRHAGALLSERSAIWGSNLE